MRLVALIACAGCNQLLGIQNTRLHDAPPPLPDAVGCSGVELIGPTAMPGFGDGDLDPALSPLELWFDRVDTTNVYAIYHATRASPDVAFDPTTIALVSELSSSSNDHDPTVTEDGLDIIFASNRAAFTDRLWEATRADISQPWSNVHQINELSALDVQSGHAVSYDGLLVYYADGDDDLYVVQRATRNDPFGSPSQLLASGVAFPSVSPDQLELFYEKPVTSGVFRRTRVDPTLPFDPATDQAIEAMAGDPYMSGDPTILLLDDAPGMAMMTRTCP